MKHSSALRAALRLRIAAFLIVTGFAALGVQGVASAVTAPAAAVTTATATAATTTPTAPGNSTGTPWD